MKTIFALLMLTAAAQAQTTNCPTIWNRGLIPLQSCTNAVEAPPSSTNYICMFEASAVTTTDKEDCIRRGGQLQPLYSSTMGGSVTLSTSPGVSITNSVRSCDEGWTLVATGSGYKCARELREPK